MRETIRLVCTEAKDSGSVYVTDKNKKTTTKKLELRKYNKVLKRHTIHRESK